MQSKIAELEARLAKSEREPSAVDEAIVAEIERIKATPIWLEITNPDGSVTRDKADLNGNQFKLRFNRKTVPE